MPSKSNPRGDNKYFSIEPASDKERRNTLLTLLAVFVTGLLAVYINPTELFFNDVLGIKSVNGCPLLTFAGVPCPMCGMGRVFSCITDLHIARSLHYNPLGLVFYLLIGFVFYVILVLSFKKKKLILKKPAQSLWYIPVLFLLVMWILNIIYGHHH